MRSWMRPVYENTSRRSWRHTAKLVNPIPGYLWKQAKGWGLIRHTGIVIEDSPAGVLAAHRAGYRCIAVSSLLTPQESKTANLVVDRLDHVDFADIEKILAD